MSAIQEVASQGLASCFGPAPSREPRSAHTRWVQPTSTAASIASGFAARAILWKLGIELLLGDVGLAQKRTSPQLPYSGRSTRGCLTLSVELLCFSPRCPETVRGAGLRHYSYRGVQRSRAPPCAASVLG